MIELSLLGPIVLRADDGRELASVVAQPKRLAVLIYLAAARPGGFQRRDKIIGLLWPEFDQARARQALSKAVHLLRRFLGEDAIVSRGDQELALDETVVRCDVRAFDDAIAAGSLETALGLYRGDFADGLFVDEAPELDRWIETERERLRAAAAKAASSAADAAFATNPAAAVEWARRATILAPYDESAVRRLMAALERTGDRARAAQVHDEFAKRLFTDLQLAPSAETKAARESIGIAPVAAIVAPAAPVASRALAVPVSARPPMKRRTVGIVSIAVVAAAIAIFATVRRSSSTRRLASHNDDRRVLVTALENRTGDSSLNALGAMASDWMAQGLSAADIMPVVSSRDARENGAGPVISGAFYKQGDSVRFQVRLSDPGDGGGNRAFQPVTAPAANPTTGLELLRQQALSLLAQVATPTPAVLLRGSPRPPLYAAYREYLAGVDLDISRDDAGAYVHFVHAYQLDTTFTVALLDAAFTGVFGPTRMTDSIAALLVKRRDELSPLSNERLDLILAIRRGDVQEQLRLLADLSRRIPDSPFPYLYANALLHIERVRTAHVTLAGIDPQHGWMKGWFPYWVVRTMVDHILGDDRDELADLEIGERQYPRNVAIAVARARWIATHGTLAELDSVLDDATSLPPSPSWDVGSVMATAGLEAAAHGRADWLPDIRARTLTWANSLPAPEPNREVPNFGLTWVFYCVGAWPELEARVTRLAAESPADTRWLILRGVLAAHRGDTAAARVIDRALAGKIAAGDAGVSGSRTLLFGRAQIAGTLGDRPAAVEHLREALAAGYQFTVYLHSEPSFASMRDYPPFMRLAAPKD